MNAWAILKAVWVWVGFSSIKVIVVDYERLKRKDRDDTNQIAALKSAFKLVCNDRDIAFHARDRIEKDFRFAESELVKSRDEFKELHVAYAKALGSHGLKPVDDF